MPSVAEFVAFILGFAAGPDGEADVESPGARKAIFEAAEERWPGTPKPMVEMALAVATAKLRAEEASGTGSARRKRLH